MIACEKKRSRPPTYVVICSCGKTWRVVGSKDKAERRHWLHRNDLEGPREFDGKTEFREAMETIWNAGIRFTDEGDSPTEAS